MASISFDALTPAEVVTSIGRSGATRGNMRIDKIFLSAVSAGCLLAFACGTVLGTNASPWFQENAPGLIRTLSALVFPYGLCMIILTGADLCTGSFMFTTIAALQGRLAWHKMIQHWIITFFGNLAGSLFVTIIVFGYGGIFTMEPFKSSVVTFAMRKQLTPSFLHIFLRGIGCNWLVCLAIFFGLQGRDLTSKVVGIWWPIFSFVSLGFDHVVANMTFIPMAIFLGSSAQGVTVGLYIWKGIVPALLGNFVGGGLFCGVYYWYMYSLTSSPMTLIGLVRGKSEESTQASFRTKGDVEANAGAS